MFSRMNQIIALTAFTAGVHFSRAAADPEIRILFILNGLGYFALVWAYYFAPQLASRRSLIRKIYLGYTTVTILFYGIWVAMSGDWTLPLGPIDKLAEIILLVQLWKDKV